MGGVMNDKSGTYFSVLLHGDAGYFFYERQVVSDSRIPVGIPACASGGGSETDNALLNPNPGGSSIRLSPLQH